LLNQRILKRERYNIPEHLQEEFNFLLKKIEKAKEAPNFELYDGCIVVLKTNYGKYYEK
jgi:hypothetical protein